LDGASSGGRYNVDAPRLERAFPGVPFGVEPFVQFHFLTVEETAALDNQQRTGVVGTALHPADRAAISRKRHPTPSGRICPLLQSTCRRV